MSAAAAFRSKRLLLTFHDGLSPEAIARECFPTLSLEQVYGASAAYLANRAEVDGYLRTQSCEAGVPPEEGRGADLEFSKRMARARRELIGSAAQ